MQGGKHHRVVEPGMLLILGIADVQGTLPHAIPVQGAVHPDILQVPLSRRTMVAQNLVQARPLRRIEVLLAEGIQEVV